MIPSIGRTVHYELSQWDVDTINATRLERARRGNAVVEGDVYPMVIVRVWGVPATETTGVNGQVVLDGEDTLWVASRTQGEGPGHWREPARV